MEGETYVIYHHVVKSIPIYNIVIAQPRRTCSETYVKVTKGEKSIRTSIETLLHCYREGYTPLMVSWDICRRVYELACETYVMWTLVMTHINARVRSRETQVSYNDSL